MLNSEPWRTGFSLRNRRRNNLRGLPLGSKRPYSMPKEFSCGMSQYEKHGIESSCVLILLPLGNYEWGFYVFSMKWMRWNQTS